MDIRVCETCKKILDSCLFYNRVATSCQRCCEANHAKLTKNRTRRVTAVFNATEEYRDLFFVQGGRCAICDYPEMEVTRVGKLKSLILEKEQLVCSHCALK